MKTTDETRWKKFLLSLTEREQTIIRAAAASSSPKAAIVTCALYFPKLSAQEAVEFMEWVAAERSGTA